MKKRNYSIGTIGLFLIVGGIFTAIGVALCVIMLKGLIQYGIVQIGAGIVMPLILILALLGFGITGLVMGGKQIYLWISEVKTNAIGRESTAQIVDYKSASFGKRANIRIRYALILSYQDGKETKKFTTDHLFDVNEFRYLKELRNIKVKINGNFVAVSEPFSKEIYKLDSTYGIEIAFYKQKPVAILLRLWSVCFFIALVFFIVSMVVGNEIARTAAIVILFTVHFPFALALAVFLIKWFNRKK